MLKGQKEELMYRQTIIKGAIILTIANVITRVIGFFYRIYMAKTIGAEGMGLYQLITPLYMLVWSVSSSGLSTTMSKLTAQEKARGAIGNVKRILHFSVFASVLIALLFSLITYNFSELIAEVIVKDTRTALSLRIISICFPFMAAGSVLRGYYLGLQNTSISAVSQVLEQSVRMIVIYILASSFIPRGLEYACGAAVWGMAIGEIVSFLFVFIYYIFNRQKYSPPIIKPKGALAMICAMAVPLTLNRMAGSLFSTAENLLIPQHLQVYGLTQAEAISLLGRLTGMAMPLITFPSSLLTALATAAMPAISESYALKNHTRIKSTLHQSLTITAVISAFTTGIFIAFPTELGILVYSQSQIGTMLKTLAILCPFIYTQVTMSAVLNGLGEQLFIFKTGLFSSVINICAICFAIPFYGIQGFIYPWIINSIAVTFITIFRVNNVLNINIPVLKQYIKPTLAITAACLCGNLGLHNVWNNIEYKHSIIATILCTSFIYVFLIFQLGCIKKEDLLK